MIKKLGIILLVLFSVESAYAQGWKWQKKCQPGPETKCEVWFNHISSFPTIATKVGDQTLATTYKTYGEMHSESSSFMLVQTSGLSASQLSRLQASLDTFVIQKKGFQDLALYQSGISGLIPLATLGSTKQKLQKEVKMLTVQNATSTVDRDLIDIAKILAGSNYKRKVIYWFTPGSKFDDDRLNKIKKHVKKAKARLVIVHLKLSELSTNTATSLQKLSQNTPGLFISLGSFTWESNIPPLVNYGNNGGIITIATADLCGEQTLKLQANAESAILKQTWQGKFRDCPPDEPAIPPVVEPPAETPETPTVPEGETSPEKPTPSPIGETPEDSAPKATNLFIVIGAGLGIIALIVIMFLLRKKPSPTGSMSYGYLTSLSGNNGQRYSISSSATKIGRSEDNDIILQDESISAHHAVIKRERDGHINIIDLNSSNGVKVNGKEIEQAKLASGDEIELGESKFRFGIEG